MRDTEVNQPGLFTAGHHLDRKTQSVLSCWHEGADVLGDAKRVGADRPHLAGLEAAQALAKAGQTIQRTVLRVGTENLVGA